MIEGSKHDRSRVALITGGSRGIGRAVALQLAARGDQTMIIYKSDGAAARAVVAEITDAGGCTFAYQADVAVESEVMAAFDAASGAFGGVDVVVHAAGRSRVALLADLDIKDLDELYSVNIRGAFLVVREAVRRVRPGGSIVTFSTSVIGLRSPGYSAYGASKVAVDALTQITAQELRGRDITINAVAPGPTATDLFYEGKDQATIDRLTLQAPMERLGMPTDVARAVDFLTTADGRWVNGQVVRVNGGIL